MIKSGLRAEFPEAKGRREKRTLYGLVSSGADFQIRDVVLGDPAVIGTDQKIWVKTSDDVDTFLKGQMSDEAVWPSANDVQITAAKDGVALKTSGQGFAEIHRHARNTLRPWG